MDLDHLPFNLSMYQEVPQECIRTEICREMCVERLGLYNILQHVEHNPDLSLDDQLAASKSKLRLLLSPIKPEATAGPDLDAIIESRYIDKISHFVLSVAYCKTRTFRDFFLRMETKWFQLIWDRGMSDDDKIQFLYKNRLDYLTVVHAQERGALDLDPSVETYVKCRFTQAPEMVRMRKYRLYKGFLYFSKTELAPWLLNLFRKNLEKRLVFMSKSQMSTDRLEPVLHNIDLVKTTSRYAKDDIDVNLSNIDEYAERHFPLCMRFLHEKLRETHYHKHFSRTQFGLFIKGIGFTLEDALEFWHAEMSRSGEDRSKINKNMYFFRHQYGTVGSCINAEPFDCSRIWQQDVSPDKFHGCPFKHWDGVTLQRKLESYGVNDRAIDEISKLKSTGHFGQACARYYQWSNGQKLPDGEIAVTHPNVYFIQSCKSCREDPFNQGDDCEVSDIEDLLL